MHIDLNSCFATVEQQANPLLRGKPIAVAAYDSPGACILAPSVEAKQLGVSMGMRVREGKALCPSLIIRAPDPEKYRFVNRKLLLLLSSYSSEVFVKSIDEMVINFANSPHHVRSLIEVAGEIKRRIREEVGDWLRVSVGISTNRFLAKVASGLKKPDGLVVIDHTNIEKTLAAMKLNDMYGIKKGNISRLSTVGILTPLQFYQASTAVLKRAFASIAGYYWYLRLHGFEIDGVEFSRKSFGNSYHLYKFTNDNVRLSQILCKLVEKMGRRVRRAGFCAQGVHISCLFADWSYWHHGHKLPHPLFTNSEFYREAMSILTSRRSKSPVRILAVSCFDLDKNFSNQLSLLSDRERQYRLTCAMDAINQRWGDYVIACARTLDMNYQIHDRIAFGGITELEEFMFQDSIQSENYFDDQTCSQGNSSRPKCP